jgi:hypothetical protein
VEGRGVDAAAYEYRSISGTAFIRCKTNRKFGVISIESSRQIRKKGVKEKGKQIAKDANAVRSLGVHPWK